MERDERHYRELIQRHWAELKEGVESGRDATATVELDQTRQGRLSRMDALQGQAMAQVARRRAEQEQQRLQAALKRLDESEYGFCFECGEDIPDGRLEIDPAATLCIECASVRETR